MIDRSLDAALRTMGELVAAGRLVALEHRPDEVDGAAVADEFAGLLRRIHGAGLAAGSEVTLPVGLLGAAAVRDLAATAGPLGVPLALSGPGEDVDPLAAELPREPRVIVPAAEPRAEARCRARGERPVRLLAGDGRAADLTFVRCLNIRFAGAAHTAVGTADRTLLAVAGERAAWYERPPESWEYVMPHGVRVEEQRRLVAGGHRVRVTVRSGPPDVVAVLGAALRRLTGRGIR